jgi:hypothetical protein
MLHEEAGYTTASDLSHRHDSVFSLTAGRSPYTPCETAQGYLLRSGELYLDLPHIPAASAIFG